MKKKLTLILFCVSFLGFSQKNDHNFPQNYFGSPLTIPLYLAGNFAELRTNHFHAGIDIKTEGREGLEVLASAEGFVSRIRVQEGGYGKVLYIDHPNGYTTVYAHLQKFSDKINEVLLQEQYKNGSFTVDFYPQKNAIKVTKGEVVALSGNTGGSGGPHLHFEIRDTKTEDALNVLLFGLPIQDHIAPIINGIKLYPLSNNALINGAPKDQYFDVVGKDKNYGIQNNITVSGKIGFGISTIDKLNGSHNQCGVFKIQLRVNDALIFEQKTTKVGFDESKYINSHTDYHLKKLKHQWVHKSFIEPGNELSIYTKTLGDGVYHFSQDTTYKVEYTITDAYNNTSKVLFNVTGKSHSENIITPLPENFVQKFEYQKENTYATNGVLITIPEGALYTDINFEYYTAPHPSERYSNIHYIHNDFTPLHKPMEAIIQCWPPSDVPSSKLVIIRKDHNQKISALTGTFADGYFSFKSKYFGSFYLYKDIDAPTIKPLNIYNSKNISAQSTIAFKIGDDLSGIASYNCFVDGKWILMEFDPKSGTLIHYKSDVIPPGEHQLELIVIDEVGNSNTYKCNFVN